METWTSLLADIRADLQDTSENPRWSNKTLLVFARDAIRDYSNWFPRRVDQQVMFLDNGKYPLPQDFIEDIQVESPLNTLLERRESRPGSRYLSKSPKTYIIQGGNLYIPGTPQDVYITYFATHLVPTSESDPMILTVPDRDLELIRLFVKAKCYEQLRGRQANLDRFKAVGDRQDNPLQPENTSLMMEYQAKIAQRIPGGVITLYRVGRLK